MPTRRPYTSYNDGCAAAHSLDIVGDRWSLLVARELLLGPKRFSDLQRDVRGISATALTQCLRDLEGAGVLRKRMVRAPAPAALYQLTPWGEELEAVIRALSTWGVRSPDLPWEADMGPDTIVLAMRAHARSAPALERDRSVALLLRDARFADDVPTAYAAVVGPSRCAVEKRTAVDPDCRIHTDSRTWQHLLFGRTDLDTALDAEQITLEPDTVASRGDVEALLRATRPLGLPTP